MKNLDLLINEREAAEILSVSVSFLRQHRCKSAPGGSAPPFYRIGRAIRYSRRDLELFLKQNKNHKAVKK